MRQVERENKDSKTKVSLRKSKWRLEKMKTKKREASKTKKKKQKKKKNQRERNEVWSPECSTSDYSNLAADINLNEVTSGVGGQPQHSHPGTPHPNLFHSLLSIKPPLYLISETPFEASEWVTSATPHAVGTNRGITEFGIAFWFGRVSGMGWWENRKEGRRRYRRLPSLSGHADKHRRTHIPIWVPTDRDATQQVVSVPVPTDD